MVEAPNILDEYGVSMMRYYRDTDNLYYYLEKLGWKVYDGKIMELEKSFTNHVGSSGVGLLSVDARFYFDEFFRKIMEDNHVWEERIMSRIEVVAKEAEEGREKLKE